MEQGQGRPLIPQWWVGLDGEGLRAAAYGFASALDDSSAEKVRREDFLVYAEQYLGRPVKSLSDFITSTGDSAGARATGRSKRNLTRIYVDAAMSRFAKTETRIQFLTNGGTPAQQARGEVATDAVNALMEQTESEVELRKAALHACVFDLGVVKVIDHDDGPTVEHVASWEIMFDPADAHRGRPTILVQRFVADREALIADFAAFSEGDSKEEYERKKDLRDAIRLSSIAGMQTPDNTRSDQHCLVYELYRLPVGKRPGRHVVVTDRGLCLDEKWTEKHFPYVRMGYSQQLFGPYPESIAAIVSGLQDEDAGCTTRIGQILRLCGVPRYIDEGPDGTTPVQLRGGTDAIGDVIGVPPGHKLEAMNNGQIIAPEFFSYREQLKADGFEMTGISAQTAIGSRPAGLNSAPAQREWNEINQDRLSLVALDYQDAHVNLGSLLLESVAKIPTYCIDIKHPNGRWMKKMKVAELDLDNSDYLIQRFPVGALPSTPTGKLAAGLDLLQAGGLDLDEFRDLMQFPDLKAKLTMRQSGRKAAEKLINGMLTKGRYIAPPELLSSGPTAVYAAQYAASRYMEGIAEDMDEKSLTLLSDWFNEIRSRMEKSEAANPPPPTAAGADLAGTSLAPITPGPLAPNPGDLAAATATPGLVPGLGLS